MKSTGITRPVDALGRIVIPKEYREFYHLDHNDEVFIVDTKEGSYSVKLFFLPFLQYEL